MAIEDFGGTVLGKKIEIVQADVQNKADVAATIAGRWFDTEKVDVILGTGASSASIATSRVADDKKKIYLATDPASSDITGKLCNAYTVHWIYDTFGAGQRHRLGGRQGRRQDLVLPHRRLCLRLCPASATSPPSSPRPAARCWASVRHPINTTDFSSFLLQAQASKAQIIGLANAGGDTINSIKQAAEFGIVKGGQKLAGLLVFVTDIHSLGLERAQGLNLTEAFYWDLNDKTRAFAKRFAAKNNGKMPTSIQAGFYSAALQYLNAVKAAGTDNSDTGDGQAQGDQVGRPGLRPELHPRRRPQDARHVPVRGQEAVGVQRPLRLLQAGRDDVRPKRPSGRSTRANARWSKKN